MGLVILAALIIFGIVACQPRLETTIKFDGGATCLVYTDHMQCVDKDGQPLPTPPTE